MSLNLIPFPQVIDPKTTDWGSFPFGIFNQMFNGNWVAWMLLAVGICLVIMVFFLMIWWIKMPQFAKDAYTNQTFGPHNATNINCYESKRVRASHPKELPNGFSYDKKDGALYIPPKLFAGASDELNDAERELLTGVCRMEDSNIPVYLNYSIQATIVTPVFAAITQHKKALQMISQKYTDNGETTTREKRPTMKIPKQLFMQALQKIPADGYIDLEAVYFNYPIDPRHLKAVMPRSLNKSTFREFENHIRQEERGQNKKVEWALIACVIGVITLVATIAMGLFK